MNMPSLQDGIESAESAVAFMWTTGGHTQPVPIVPGEFTNWREEQSATCPHATFLDLSHHMWQIFVEGPDTTQLPVAFNANDYDHFETGRAKQFIPVTQKSWSITDGMIMRMTTESYVVSGVPAACTWVHYHTTRGDCDVRCTLAPDSANNDGSFYAPDIKDYYCSPYELGYGRSIRFNYDFIGRAALEAAKARPQPKRLTLVWGPHRCRGGTGRGCPLHAAHDWPRIAWAPSWHLHERRAYCRGRLDPVYGVDQSGPCPPPFPASH